MSLHGRSIVLHARSIVLNVWQALFHESNNENSLKQKQKKL